MWEGQRTVLLVAVRHNRCVQKYTCMASKHPTNTNTTMYPALTILIPVRASLTVSLPSRAPPATVSAIPAMKRNRVTTKHCRICRLISCSRAALERIRQIITHRNYNLVLWSNSHYSNEAQSRSDQRNHASIEEDDWSYHHACTVGFGPNNYQNSCGNANWDFIILDIPDTKPGNSGKEDTHWWKKMTRWSTPCEVACADSWRDKVQ